MSTVRTRWAWIAFWMSLAAGIAELTLSLCASSVFDPLPDGAHVVALGLVLAVLWYNEQVALADAYLWPSRNRGERKAEMRRLAAGRIGTAAALFLSGTASLMHLPFTPFALIGIVLFGLGALNFVPMICFGVLIAQWRAMGARWRALDEHGWDDPDNQAPVWPDRRPLRAAVVLVPLVLFGWFVARPLVIGYNLRIATTFGTSRSARLENSLERVRRLGGENEALAVALDRKPSFWTMVGGEAARSSAKATFSRKQVRRAPPLVVDA